MQPNLIRWSLLIGAALACMLCSPTRAQTITNGGFESGFLGWTRLDQLGSDGSFMLQSGTVSPVNGVPVPAPPGGLRAAMTDAQGPGSHVLYQDFLVPTGGSGKVAFSLFLNSGASFHSPSSLDSTTPTLNQQARVDILSVGADPFSVAGGDVLQNLFQTLPGDPTVSGYTNRQVDVSALFQARQGQTLRLRFAEADNVNFLNFGVDNVSITTDTTLEPVPEPPTLVLAGTALLPLLALFRSRRRAAPAAGALCRA